MEKMYDKAVQWIKENSEKHGDAADLMRRANAQKASWYKLLQGKGVRSESLFEWLENLGFQLVTPDETNKDQSRDVCFVNSRIVNAEDGGPPIAPEDYLAVPLIAEAGAGPGIVPANHRESWFLVYRREPSLRTRTNLIAVRIDKNSTSMEPTLHPGDIVLVDRNDKAVAQPGKIWLVMEPDGSGKVKRVKVDDLRAKRQTRLTFYSDNVQENPPEVYSLEEDYDGEWDRAIVGRVVWAWSDLTRK